MSQDNWFVFLNFLLWVINANGDILMCRREDSTEKRLQRANLNDETDARFGFDRYKDAQDADRMAHQHAPGQLPPPGYNLY